MILDATLIEIELSGYFGRKSDACVEIMPARSISDIEALRTRLLLLGQVEPTKLKRVITYKLHARLNLRHGVSYLCLIKFVRT